MRTDEHTETLLSKLEDLAQSFDDHDHGKNPPSELVADLIGALVDQYREAFGDD